MATNGTGASAPQQSKSARWVPLVILAALLAAGAAWRLKQQRQVNATQAANTSASKAAEEAKRPAAVKAALVTTGTIGQTLNVTGALKANQNVNLSSKITGRVARMLVREGDRVRRGQLLIALDDADLRAQVAAARAQLRTAQVRHQQSIVGLPARESGVSTAIHQAEVAVRQAQARYQQALKNEPAKIVAAQSQVDVARQVVKTTEERVKQARETATQTALQTASEVQRTESSVAGAQSAVKAAQAGVTQAQARVESSRAALAEVQRGARTQQIAQAQSQVNLIEAQLRNADTELTRAKRLVAGGASPQSSVDAAQTQYDVVQAQLEAARQNLSLVQEGATTEQVRQAQETVRQAEQGVLQSQQAELQAEEGVRQAEALLAQAQAARSRVAVAQGEITTALSAQAQAQSNLLSAEANLAQIPITKQETLVAREAVENARVALEQARANRSQVPIARADVQAAAAGVTTARAALQQAQVNLDYARLYSPVNGVVNQKLTDVGQAASPGTSLLNLVSLDRVYFEAQIAENSVRQVQPGQQARVSVEAVSAQPFIGYVTDIIPTADPRLRQFRVRITIPSTPRQLTPGAFARATLSTQTFYNTLLVPSDAVLTDSNPPQVLVAAGPADKATVQHRRVKVGISVQGRTQILGGVARGERVIVGQSDLPAGETVRVETD